MNKVVWAIWGVVIVSLISLFGFALSQKKVTNDRSQATSLAEVIDGISCNEEMTAIHYHVHLTLLEDGNQLVLPAEIGVRPDKRCLYWLHTHDEDGIIHIESPTERDFTLGQFFEIWGQTLSETEAGILKAPDGERLRFFVDGEKYEGSPRDIVFKSHQVLTIESGKEVTPPTYDFPEGL